VPQPGNPGSLNRYSYVLNNPLRYTDPSGHWAETVWDVANIAWDIHELKQNPKSLLNWGALVLDVGATVLPFVPAGAGLIARGGKAAKIGAQVATHGDEAVDAVRAVDRVSDAASGLRRFTEVGTEILPDVLKAFGDEGRVVGELPAVFQDRGQRVIGRWWDTEVAEAFGERIFKPAAGANWTETAAANSAWIQDAIKNGDVFYLASPVDSKHLLPALPEHGVAVFARELDALLQAGYRRVGDYLVPPH